MFGLGLAAWTFADAVFPLDVPDRATTSYLTAGGATALLVLGSLALHEAGHWLVARRAGLPVTRLALTLVGGTLELGSAPRSAATELRIALGGPLASLLTALAAAAQRLGDQAERSPRHRARLQVSEHAGAGRVEHDALLLRSRLLFLRAPPWAWAARACS